jgi:hypothetical protein
VHYAVHLFRVRLWDFAIFMISFLAVRGRPGQLQLGRCSLHAVPGLPVQPEALRAIQLCTCLIHAAPSSRQVCFMGVELGLIPAVAMPLLTMMVEAAIPPTAVMGQVPGTTAYR